jgi:hypothetical protein
MLILNIYRIIKLPLLFVAMICFSLNLIAAESESTNKSHLTTYGTLITIGSSTLGLVSYLSHVHADADIALSKEQILQIQSLRELKEKIIKVRVDLKGNHSVLANMDRLDNYMLRTGMIKKPWFDRRESAKKEINAMEQLEQLKNARRSINHELLRGFKTADLNSIQHIDVTVDRCSALMKKQKLVSSFTNGGLATAAVGFVAGTSLIVIDVSRDSESQISDDSIEEHYSNSIIGAYEMQNY